MKKKIALVTGAARGIGKAIMERFIREEYFVIAVDVDKKREEELLSGSYRDRTQYILADITDSKAVKHLFGKLIQEHGHIDVLVNNAGIIRDKMIWEMSEEDFDRVINVNLKGTWLMCREASVIMKEQGRGRIINISSRAWLGNRGQSNYSPSKAGVISLTRVLALELGKYNVQVNAIAPGLIDTPLTQSLKKEVLQKLIDTQPTKTMGKPEDVANAVAFLANEETGFITGQVIYVDGGKNIGAGI